MVETVREAIIRTWNEQAIAGLQGSRVGRRLPHEWIRLVVGLVDVVDQ